MASKGKRVRSDTKFIVCNLYDYFERESQKNMKVHQGGVKLKKKTVDATGLSKRTVDAILAEKRSLGGGEFESPRKCYKKSRARVDPDNLTFLLSGRQSTSSMTRRPTLLCVSFILL